MSALPANRWQISLQPHLRERMLERFPGVKPARAVDEVREALAAGRLSAERPSWCGYPRDHQHAISLYAWTEDRKRVYILHTTEREFIVMSVLSDALPPKRAA